jgi:hypothetical protein
VWAAVAASSPLLSAATIPKLGVEEAALLPGLPEALLLRLRHRVASDGGDMRGAAPAAAALAVALALHHSAAVRRAACAAIARCVQADISNSGRARCRAL